MNINRIVITGNLTRDPELRNLPSGTAVCSLRIASNTGRKDPSTNQWTEKPNYFDVVVWGGQAENCARYLAKGRSVAIDGRLEWREFETREGEKRQAVEIVAEQVQFLSRDTVAESRDSVRPGGGVTSSEERSSEPAARPDPSDDIPF